MYVDISEKKILVVGGGRIALRRVKTLAQFNRHITVVSPELTQELQNLPEEGEIQWIRKIYEKEDLGDSDMVLACTNDSTLNETICRDGRERGMMVNNCSDKGMCDFYFPALIRQEDVVISLCSGGTDHRKVSRIAQMIRDLLKTR